MEDFKEFEMKWNYQIPVVTLSGKLDYMANEEDAKPAGESKDYLKASSQNINRNLASTQIGMTNRYNFSIFWLW